MMEGGAEVGPGGTTVHDPSGAELGPGGATVRPLPPRPPPPAQQSNLQDTLFTPPLSLDPPLSPLGALCSVGPVSPRRNSPP